MSRAKQTRGRQKITMAKIENHDDCLVTFSKRRSGIYKKASELAILCDAEIGILVFSPAEKPFSFGNMSLESIIDRLLGKTDLPSTDNTQPLVQAYRRVKITELAQYFIEVVDRSDAEKEKGDRLKRITRGKEKDTGAWWDTPIDIFNVDELKNTYFMCEKLHRNLCNNVDQSNNDGALSSSSPLAFMNSNFPNSRAPMMMNNPFVGSNPDPIEFPNVPYGYGFGNIHY